MTDSFVYANLSVNYDSNGRQPRRRAYCADCGHRTRPDPWRLRDGRCPARLPGWPATLNAEYLSAPHKPKPLRSGHGAVYIFALADANTSDAGSGRALKVGRVGPNSNARFQSQHYSPASSRSNLANSILGYPALWSWLGIDQLDTSTVRDWMLTHLDRANVYVPASSAELIPQLEMYVRARLGGSVYEGSA